MATKFNLAAQPTPYSFMYGSIQDRRVVRVVAQIDAITRSGSDETHLMLLDLLTRRWFARDVEFRVVAQAVLPDNPPIAFSVGGGGDVWVGNPQVAWEEHIDKLNDGPKRRGPIRTVQVVGCEVLVAGMSRQVYRRVAKNKWERADNGLVQERGELQVSGINAIDGTPDGSLVAVGFLGEIWERLSGRWIQRESPTNLILHDVKVFDGGGRVCCGQEGLILTDSGNGWEVFAQSETTADLWAVDHAQGRTYFAAEDGLFMVSAGKSLERVDVGKHSEGPFRHVHTNAGLILAIGTKAVLISGDGLRWDDVTP